jgi:hypothetical protein
MDNYELSRNRAQVYFLGFDQEILIQKWKLQADDATIFVPFLGRPYGIDRSSGMVTRLWNGEQAQYSEVLSIFDFLCHEGEKKQLSGQFAPVNSLNGCAKGAGVGTDFHSSIASRFDADAQSFRNACISLGGTPVKMGDIGFEFPVFQNIKVILKFYHADEEFPASLTLLWDANMLQFVFYETVFYIAGCLLGMILEEMK